MYNLLAVHNLRSALSELPWHSTCAFEIISFPKSFENLQFCGKIYYLAFIAEHSSEAETVMTCRTFFLQSVIEVMNQSLLRIGQCKSLPWHLNRLEKTEGCWKSSRDRENLCLAFSKLKELKTNKTLQ